MTCKICGEEDCKRHTMLFAKARKITEFSGASPPEIFVGKWNYPNVYTGILSPEEHGDTQELSSYEIWQKKKLPIANVLELRDKLIYGRTQTNVHKPRSPSQSNSASKFLGTMQEVAMTHKSISAEYKLKKPVTKHDERESRVPLISNAAPVESVRLEENAKILPKIDYLVNDTDVKSTQSLVELDKSSVPTSNLVKLLSAGLLGLKKNRKLVPTRWSISAVDSTLSDNKIAKIKDYQQISEYLVFHDEYVGNHYEILLIPRFWNFEVIEISLKNGKIWKDYESNFKRKDYADEVTGGYYAARLSVAEYLERIKKQASVLVLRQISPQYYSPLGVGILREITRSAFKNEPRKFSTLKEALDDIQARLRIPTSNYLKESQLMKSLQQTTITNFI